MSVSGWPASGVRSARLSRHPLADAANLGPDLVAEHFEELWPAVGERLHDAFRCRRVAVQGQPREIGAVEARIVPERGVMPRERGNRERRVVGRATGKLIRRAKMTEVLDDQHEVVGLHIVDRGVRDGWVERRLGTERVVELHFLLVEPIRPRDLPGDIVLDRQLHDHLARTVVGSTSVVDRDPIQIAHEADADTDLLDGERVDAGRRDRTVLAHGRLQPRTVDLVDRRRNAN